MIYINFTARENEKELKIIFKESILPIYLGAFLLINF